MSYKLCPHVGYVSKGHQRGSVFCNSFICAPYECERCGWNPEEHKRRVSLIRAGVVKSFLKIDLSRLVADTAKEYRTQQNGEEILEEEGW